MASELVRLLAKAVRQLPPEEQDRVLEELLRERVERAGGPPSPRLESLAQALGPPVTPALHHLAHPFTEPKGGWQAVPVRLSGEQHERLKQWCQANNFTMAVVLRGLVARFLDEQARRAAPPAPGEDPA